MIVYQGIIYIMPSLYNHYILNRIYKILRKLVLNMSNSSINMSNRDIAINKLCTNIINVNKQRKYLLLGKYYFKKAKKYNPNNENVNRALKKVEETLYKKFKK